MNIRTSALWTGILVLTLSGCVLHRKHPLHGHPTSAPGPHERAVPPAPPSEAPQGKPPAHAKAHGLRRQWNYFYYPSDQVYYAPDREVYFWIQGDGWAVGAQLPGHILIELEDGVLIELGTETPYDKHDDVIKKHKPKKRGRGRG